MKPISDKNFAVNRSGFTLVELAVVIGLIAVLAALMLPAIGATKPGAMPAHCLNNQRQLALAWQMYASDNADSLISPTAWISTSGGFMDWTASASNTNTAALTDPSQALIGAYIRNATVFKCPADNYQSAANPGPRVRSISCNLALGSFPTFKNQNGFTYFSAKKITDLAKPGPARTFVFVDEHPDSIDDGAFALDPGYAIGSEKWRNLPASYHNGAAGISFTDGHADLHAWVDKGTHTGQPQTFYPVLFINYSSVPAPWSTAGSQKLDYEWLEGGMPYQ